MGLFHRRPTVPVSAPTPAPPSPDLPPAPPGPDALVVEEAVDLPGGVGTMVTGTLGHALEEGATVVLVRGDAAVARAEVRGLRAAGRRDQPDVGVRVGVLLDGPPRSRLRPGDVVRIA